LKPTASGRRSSAANLIAIRARTAMALQRQATPEAAATARFFDNLLSAFGICQRFCFRFPAGKGPLWPSQEDALSKQLEVVY
jgi:hypothetical protein